MNKGLKGSGVSGAHSGLGRARGSRVARVERGAPKDLGELKGRLSIEAAIVEHLVPAFAGYSGVRG